jgi:SAM-dependent methyltransferase
MSPGLSDHTSLAERGPGGDAVRLGQEAEYVFPYHFIPSLGGDGFSTTRHWSWGMHYLGGLHLVGSLLREYDFHSLVDIGCGDGRFLADLRQAYPDARLVGFDYSDRSIAFARAFAPAVDFRAIDIVTSPPAEVFDIATMIEVLEHIPPAEADAFLSAAKGCLKPGGALVLTVPHVNSPVIEKHYRHFTARSLREALEPHFKIEAIGFFDRAGALPLKLVRTLLGGGGRQFVITHRLLNQLLWNIYLRRYLHTDDERDCRRLYAVVRRPL